MSRKATDWAWSLEIKSATLKLLLLSLADRADEYHQCFPSISRLEKDTGLNRKTIMQNVKKLIEMGMLIDTGNRCGQTQQVKVYRLNLNSTENGTVPKTEQYRNYQETVPFLPDNSTKNGTQNQSLTSQEPNNNKPRAKEKVFNPTNYLGSLGVNPDIAKDWLELRKSKHAPATKTAIDGVIHEATKANYSLEQALIFCCVNSWQGFKAEWVANQTESRGNTNAISHRNNKKLTAKEKFLAARFGGNQKHNIIDAEVIKQ